MHKPLKNILKVTRFSNKEYGLNHYRFTIPNELNFGLARFKNLVP